MAARKNSTDDATRSAYDATTRPSDAARVLGVDGKRFRNALRKSGVYVSRGGVFDADAHAAMWERFAPKHDA